MSYYHAKLVIRITVLGAKNTGKSTLVNCYVNNDVVRTDLLEPVDSAYRCETVVEGKQVTHQILDSDGKNSAVTAWSHGVIVTFSVDDADSFKEAEQQINRVKQITMKDASIMLVANKSDCKHRQVSLEEGQKLANLLRCSYVELSALSDANKVKSVFYQLSHDILHKRGHMTKHHRTPHMVRRVFQAITNVRERRSASFL